MDQKDMAQMRALVEERLSLMALDDVSLFLVASKFRDKEVAVMCAALSTGDDADTIPMFIVVADDMVKELEAFVQVGKEVDNE